LLSLWKSRQYVPLFVVLACQVPGMAPTAIISPLLVVIWIALLLDLIQCVHGAEL